MPTVVRWYAGATAVLAAAAGLSDSSTLLVAVVVAGLPISLVAYPAAALLGLSATVVAPALGSAVALAVLWAADVAAAWSLTHLCRAAARRCCVRRRVVWGPDGRTGEVPLKIVRGA